MIKQATPLAGVVQLVESHSVHREIAGSIPYQVTCPGYRLDSQYGGEGRPF